MKKSFKTRKYKFSLRYLKLVVLRSSVAVSSILMLFTKKNALFEKKAFFEHFLFFGAFFEHFSKFLGQFLEHYNAQNF